MTYKTGSNTNMNVKLEYDPLNGKFLREVKPSDIIVLGGHLRPNTTTCASSTSGFITVGTFTTDANTVLYPYLMVITSNINDTEFGLVVGTTTMYTVLTTTANPTFKIEMRPFAPICKVPASTTLYLVAMGITNTTTTNLIQGYVTCKREPIPERLEPASF